MNSLAILIYFIATLGINSEPVKSRAKRWGIFPQTSPTRHQLIAGIGIPVPLASGESVTSGYVFKAAYYLPTAIEDLKPDFFWPDRTEFVTTNYGKRSIRDEDEEANSVFYDNITQTKVERYDVEVVQLDEQIFDEDTEENDDNVNEESDFKELIKKQNIQNSRWTAYKMTEAVIEHNGLPGCPCLLRCICEATQTPFNHEYGMIGELMNVILVPSTTDEDILSHKDNQYYKAESIGKTGEPCDRVFYECPSSVLEVFSSVVDPMTIVGHILGY